MKTHSLAKELIALGNSLLGGPNMETKGLSTILSGKAHSDSRSNTEMTFGITTLAQLSKHSRTEWIDFATTHSIKISFTARDSARNIMGKIMSYLAENESEIQRVRLSVAHSKEPSNRLNQALNILLKNSNS
jgi:hypothetical protein